MEKRGKTFPVCVQAYLLKVLWYVVSLIPGTVPAGRLGVAFHGFPITREVPLAVVYIWVKGVKEHLSYHLEA